MLVRGQGSFKACLVRSFMPSTCLETQSIQPIMLTAMLPLDHMATVTIHSIDPHCALREPEALERWALRVKIKKSQIKYDSFIGSRFEIE